MPSKLTTAVSMQSVITRRDPSFVAAGMDLVEMASTVQVNINYSVSGIYEHVLFVSELK